MNEIARYIEKTWSNGVYKTDKADKRNGDESVDHTKWTYLLAQSKIRRQPDNLENIKYCY